MTSVKKGKSASPPASSVPEKGENKPGVKWSGVEGKGLGDVSPWVLTESQRALHGNCVSRGFLVGGRERGDSVVVE